MTEKNKSIQAGDKVRIKVQSEIVSGTIVHVWFDKSVQMVRIQSQARVYNLPISFLVADGRKSK